MSEKNIAAVQIAEVKEGWLIPEKGVIPFNKLTDDELKKAIFMAEKKELIYFNRSSFFATLWEKLMSEADSRELSVTHFNTEYTEKAVEARTNKEA